MSNCEGCKYDCSSGCGCSHPKVSEPDFWNRDSSTCYEKVVREKEARVFESFYESVDYYNLMGSVRV